MTDMTIKAVRTTMLRVPWPDTPWLKGHAFGDARNILVLEVETKGGIVGMGYLLLFRLGIKAIVACRTAPTASRCLRAAKRHYSSATAPKKSRTCGWLFHHSAVRQLGRDLTP